MSPKLHVKPTPIQAQALRMLAEHPGVSVTEVGLWLAGRSYHHGLPKLPQRTVRSLIREEWIQPNEATFGAGYELSRLGLAVVQALTDSDFQRPPPKLIDAAFLLRALKRMHPAPEWLFVRELRLGTGWGTMPAPNGEWVGVEHRMDAWALHTWPSRKFERHAFEVKVSRQDFEAELNNPRKRLGALALSNFFWFVAPNGLIPMERVPEEAGLIEVEAGGRAEVVRKAPWRQAGECSWAFLASVGRALGRQSVAAATDKQA